MKRTIDATKQSAVRPAASTAPVVRSATPFDTRPTKRRCVTLTLTIPVDRLRRYRNHQTILQLTRGQFESFAPLDGTDPSPDHRECDDCGQHAAFEGPLSQCNRCKMYVCERCCEQCCSCDILLCDTCNDRGDNLNPIMGDECRGCALEISSSESETENSSSKPCK